MIKPIAFYLPQFHPVEENSLWWGPGFTEWTNVAKARPNFPGHYQPQIPRDMGFYDLRLQDTILEQAKLAKKYSIYGFCYYFYWFSGKRILEKPLDVLVASNADIDFCLCWANENWTKKWDGGDNELLMKNEHTVGNDNDFIESVLPYMQDRRYIKYNGVPLLLVYRADLLTDSKATFSHWRQRARESGLGGLFISCVNFYGIDDPRDWGGDALVEFPPHNYLNGSFVDYPPGIAEGYSGAILDYRLAALQSIKRKTSEFLTFFGAMPSWDNTARRQKSSHTFINSSPEMFEFWMKHQCVKTAADSKNSEKYLFINAWNEWAEGAHLEPCLKYEHKYLEAVHRAVTPDKYLLRSAPYDPVVQALGSLQEVTGPDLAYFSKLETHMLATLNELSMVRNMQSQAAANASPVQLPIASKKPRSKFKREAKRVLRHLFQWLGFRK